MFFRKKKLVIIVLTFMKNLFMSRFEILTKLNDGVVDDKEILIGFLYFTKNVLRKSSKHYCKSDVSIIIIIIIFQNLTKRHEGG